MTEQLFDSIESGNKEQCLSLLNENPEYLNHVFEEQGLTPFELTLNYGFANLATAISELPTFEINHKGHNPLRLAIDLGYLDLAKQLLEQGANPNYRPKQMSSALLLCLDNEYFDLAELMVEKGAEVNIRNEKGWTPLIWASMKGRVQAVDFLLKHGALVDICNNDGWNAVTGAYFKQRLEIVEKLRAEGAVFGAKFSEAAMLSAFKNGQIALAKELLKAGVNPDVEDENGRSLLILAIEKGNRDFTKSVILAGANVNVMDSSTETALSLLAKNADDELIKLMIERGADVNLTSNSKRSLHVASQYNHLTTAELLIEHGADINALDKDNKTPLMICASWNTVNVASLLLRKNANTKLRAGYRGDAREIAVDNKHYEIRNVIDEALKGSND
ncbi:ankyrin repeat domain-containing protein [Vibrio cyclitrophicus]